MTDPLAGPIQLLVLEYEDPDLSGEALEEVRRLEEAGVIRLIDVLAVSSDVEGQISTVEFVGTSPGSTSPGSVVAQLIGERDADPDPGNTGVDSEPTGLWSLSALLAPGALALLVLIEHLWATDLVAAIGRSGGRPLDELWLSSLDRDRLAELLASGS